jgi:hypothetical protein
MADAEREMSVAPKRAVATMRAIFKCRMGFLRFVSVILNPTRRFAQSRCREAEERVHPTFKESSQSHIIGSNFANYVQMLPFRAVSAREKHNGRKARLSFPSIADIVLYRRAPPLRPGAAVSATSTDRPVFHRQRPYRGTARTGAWGHERTHASPFGTGSHGILGWVAPRN